MSLALRLAFALVLSLAGWWAVEAIAARAIAAASAVTVLADARP